MPVNFSFHIKDRQRKGAAQAPKAHTMGFCDSIKIVLSGKNSDSFRNPAN